MRFGERVEGIWCCPLSPPKLSLCSHTPALRCNAKEGREAPGGWALRRRDTILLKEGSPEQARSKNAHCPLRPHKEAIFRAEDIPQDLGQPSLGAIANHCMEFTGAPGHT